MAISELEFSREWSVTPTDDLLFQLKRVLGADNIKLHFDQNDG